MSMATTGSLRKWYPHTTGPFIANAPMYGSADAELAVAVTKAGGYALGFLAGGFDFSEKSAHIPVFETQLDKARSLLSITDQHIPLPIGVGFITLLPKGFVENILPILVKHQVSGVWLSFPTKGEDHRKIISAIHSACENSNWKVKIWVQVGNLESAREAIEQGADVLVVQGVDAGGHQWAHGASIVVLIPEVRNLVSKIRNRKEVAVIAAGGLICGRGLVAAWSLGAEGIVMGTRFLCSTECPAKTSLKQQIISTGEGVLSTVKSSFHDDIQNLGVWSTTYDARALIGQAYKDHLAGLDIKDNITRHKKAIEEGDPEGRSIVFAGAGIGMIKEILSVKEIIEKTQSEVREVIGRLSTYNF